MSNLDFSYRTGRIARGHGLRGEVLIQFFRRRDITRPPDRLSWRRLSTPLPVELEHADERLHHTDLTHIRWIDPLRAVVRFTSFGDRADADRWVGAYLDVDPEHWAPELHDEVDRCFEASVLDAESGESLGTVRRISDNGAQALLEIDLNGGGEALVPVVEALVVAIDRDEQGLRCVRVRPLPGLFEVNR